MTWNHLTMCKQVINWGCRIHWLHLCRGVRPSLQWVSWIWDKTIWKWGSSNAGALGNAGYPFIATLPGPLWLGVVAPDRVLSMGQIEQTVCKLVTDVKLWLLYSNTWNHLTVCKKRAQAHLRMLSTKCVYKSYIYLIYIYV